MLQTELPARHFVLRGYFLILSFKSGRRTKLRPTQRHGHTRPTIFGRVECDLNYPASTVPAQPDHFLNCSSALRFLRVCIWCQFVALDNQGRIKDHLREIIPGTVEQALNALLRAEADQLCGAARHERTEAARVRAAADTNGLGVRKLAR